MQSLILFSNYQGNLYSRDLKKMTSKSGYTVCNIIFHFFWFFWCEKKIWWMHVGSWVEQDNFLLLLPLKKWLKSLISLTHILMLLYYVCGIYILFYFRNWHRLPCAGPLADLRMKSEDSTKTVEQNKKSVDFWVNFWHHFGGRSVEKLVKSYSKYLFIGSFFFSSAFL